MNLAFYEIIDNRGRPFSPYCWRTRESLLLLSLEFEARIVSFREIRELFAGTHKTVPVLVDGKTEIGGSWRIAEYLVQHYDPKGLLFGGPGGRLLNTFVTNWVDATILAPVNRMIVKDIHDKLQPEDQAYYRHKEEERQGRTIEQTQAGREAELAALQTALHPARRAVKEHNFLAGGPQPTYADFALHSTFQWIRTMSDFELLRPDDKLHAWIERMDGWLES